MLNNSRAEEKEEEEELTANVKEKLMSNRKSNKNLGTINRQTSKEKLFCKI